VGDLRHDHLDGLDLTRLVGRFRLVRGYELDL